MTLADILATLVPVVILGGVWLVLYRGARNARKRPASHARQPVPAGDTTTWPSDGNSYSGSADTGSGDCAPTHTGGDAGGGDSGGSDGGGGDGGGGSSGD